MERERWMLCWRVGISQFPMSGFDFVWRTEGVNLCCSLNLVARVILEPGWSFWAIPECAGWSSWAKFLVKPLPGRKATQSRGPAGPRLPQAGVTRPFQCQPAWERCWWQWGDLHCSMLDTVLSTQPLELWCCWIRDKKSQLSKLHIIPPVTVAY